MDPLTIIIDILQGFWENAESLALFQALKVFLAVYVAVLLLDIILLFFARDRRADMKKVFYGSSDMALPRRKMYSKKWKQIKQRLQSNDPSQYKVALLEADMFVDQILSDAGFKGKNMLERLEHVTPDQIANVEELRAAHQARNQVVFEPDFTLSREEAEKCLQFFEEFLEREEIL